MSCPHRYTKYASRPYRVGDVLHRNALQQHLIIHESGVALYFTMDWRLQEWTLAGRSHMGKEWAKSRKGAVLNLSRGYDACHGQLP
jgi:hypothetical protein